jgi:renalase
MMIDIAVIGAGWAGLTAAATLTAAGREVVVVDKARGPGGRSATRRQNGFHFDHGAQYFTVRSAEFRNQVEGWRDLGLVAAWAPGIHVVGPRPEQAEPSPAERLVGVPGMNAVLHYLSGKLDCRFGWRVAGLARSDHWRLIGPSGDSLQARHLLITAPPRQTAELLGENHPLSPSLTRVPMAPTWALMVGFNKPVKADFEAVFVNQGPLSWIACNSAKPERQGHAWVAHATPEWSTANLERDAEDVANELYAAFCEIVPVPAGLRAAVLTAHRWRYALSAEPDDRLCLGRREENLVIAGDWCAGNRIEGAWTSGRAAAAYLLESTE